MYNQQWIPEEMAKAIKKKKEKENNVLVLGKVIPFMPFSK